jgi:dTDP-4-dehydrorhamnose reductase
VRALVTGAGGQLGQSLRRSLPSDVVATAATRAELDITDEPAIENCFRAARPDVVINAAAFTGVDAAESNVGAAERTNIDGVSLLAEACRRSGARLIHVSTDYVFDGEQQSPYRPDDPPRPLSAYGRTKWAGEQRARDILPSASLVVRTSWLYSASGRSFLPRMLDLMNRQSTVRVVADQRGIPTAADSLARVLWAFAKLPASGIYHWSDEGPTTWYHFACAIAEQGAALGLIASAPEIVPIESSEYPAAAKRPRNSVLDRSATEALLGLKAPPWRQALRTTLEERAGRERGRA